MGTSHPETKPWVVQRILDAGCRTILDVGAGAGNWATALRRAGWAGKAYAVEVWPPYVDQFNLDVVYDKVFVEDIRTWTPGRFAYFDCVIFGDVLEHMTEEDARQVWRKSRLAPHAAIAIPIIDYHQGALNGNPYEVHVKHDWDHGQVLRAFRGITDSEVFTVTAAYWR